MAQTYEKWINNHKSTGGDDKLLDVHLERYFAHVGLGRNFQKKCGEQHYHRRGISPVFGLVCAILRLEYEGLFTTQASTYQILKTVDISHVGSNEKLTTLSCSVYPVGRWLINSLCWGINRTTRDLRCRSSGKTR